MRIVLDLTKLVAEGKLAPEQAEALKALAARDTGALAINLLVAFGAVAVAAGMIALQPEWETVALLGVVLAGAGLLLLRRRAEDWGLLGSAILLAGGLGLASGIIGLTDGGFAGFAGAATVLLGLALLGRSGPLMALVPPALAAALGSSTGYFHAAYLLVVREATIVILVFSALAFIAQRAAARRPPEYERLGTIFARVSLVLVNLGFWVGSLFGDDPGATWRGAGADEAASWWSAAESGMPVPPLAFAVAWAVALLAAAAWAARANRRFVLNAAAVFGAVHFYTQWYERLGDAPWSLIAAGALGIAFAFLLWRYNRRAAMR